MVFMVLSYYPTTDPNPETSPTSNCPRSRILWYTVKNGIWALEILLASAPTLRYQRPSLSAWLASAGACLCVGTNRAKNSNLWANTSRSAYQQVPWKARPPGRGPELFIVTKDVHLPLMASAIRRLPGQGGAWHDTADFRCLERGYQGGCKLCGVATGAITGLPPRSSACLAAALHHDGFSLHWPHQA
jgi:hypothetical protein